MKKIARVSLGSFTVLILSLVPALSAHAAPAEFLSGGAAAKAGESILLEGELLLEDMKGGIFGEGVDFLCSLLALGEILTAKDLDIISVYPLGGTDPGTGATEIKCETMAGACNEPDATAVNLPWLMEPLELESKFRGTLVSTGAGAPGWLGTCEKVLAGATECTGEAATVHLENVESMIDDNFENVFNSNAYDCTRGGLKEGLVEGIVLMETTNGLAFSVS